MTRLPRATIALLILALAGCAAAPTRPASPDAPAGEASYRPAPQPATRRYALPLGTTSSGAGLLAHPAPDYPASELATCTPVVELPARVVVDTAGRVSDVRYPAAVRVPAAYREAVSQAVSAWRYEPLVFAHWAADGNGRSHVVDSTRKPFSLDYVFVFRCRQGQGEVTATSKP